MYVIRYVAAILLIAVLGYFFPLFHIHSLEEIRRTQEMKVFDPELFVTEFWDNRLLSSLDNAVPIQTLLPLIRQNPQTAKNEYAKSVGIGSIYYYFLRGKGFVKSVHKNSIAIVLDENSQEPDLLIQSGKIFGNAIRNGTGLLNVSDFPNSQQFNQISTHLNKMVENKVLPEFIQIIKPGDVVHFVGCCEISNEKTDLNPLKLIPISVTIE